MNKPIENEHSNNDGTKIPLSDEPTFGYDPNDDDNEVQKQCKNEDFQMYITEDELTGSQHYTSKLKPKKKKKPIVLKKELLDLKMKVDQILTAVSSSHPPQNLPAASI